MRIVRLQFILIAACSYVFGDALASLLVTGSWWATAARAGGIASFVVVLFVLSERRERLS
jgi:hypothetical protein